MQPFSGVGRAFDALEIQIPVGGEGPAVPAPDIVVELAPGVEAEGFAPAPPPEPPVPFGANLALHLPETELTRIGLELKQWVDQDLSTRAEWDRAIRNGLDYLGLKYEERTEPWEKACGIYHPVLAEAVIGFQSNAILEIFPAGGPVKAKLAGQVTPQKEQQARRVVEDMNDLLVRRMPGYRGDTEQLLFDLAFSGSAFRKVYADPMTGEPVAAFVPAKDFVVPYGTPDLKSAPRYTHVFSMPPNDIRKLQKHGEQFYRDIPVPDSQIQIDQIAEKQGQLKGFSIVGGISADRDPITLCETHADLNIAGFEDPDGIQLPYIVTFVRDTGAVLSIRRNWNEADQWKRKIVHFVAYYYVPGLGGLYGLGLVHLVGGLARGATSIIRQLVDAGTLSNLPAGFKSRSMRVRGGEDTPLAPGEWRDIETASGDLTRSIVPLPYKEPSAVLANLLIALVDEARRTASIADMKIKDVSSDAPVGTALAIFERAFKVMSAVQARLHASLAQEFALIEDVIRRSGQAEYEIDFAPEEKVLRAADYDARIDVIPVSDPNAATMAQRVMQHQAALQLASQAPQFYDLPELHRNMLGALGFRDAERIVPRRAEAPRADPVQENMRLLSNQPVKAFQDQDHDAHITVHMALVGDQSIARVMGQSPLSGAFQSAVYAHLAEHIGMRFRVGIERHLGFALPDGQAGAIPDIEGPLSHAIAQASEKLKQETADQEMRTRAQQMAEDPVIQMQREELALRRMRVQIEAMKVQGDLAIERDSLKQKSLSDAAKNAVDERIAQLEAEVDVLIAKIREAGRAGS